VKSLSLGQFFQAYYDGEEDGSSRFRCEKRHDQIDDMTRDPASAEKHVAAGFEALWRIVTQVYLHIRRAIGQKS